MNTKLFSLFLVTILGFSAVSIPNNGLEMGQNAQFSINLAEDLTISSGSGQKIGNIHKIALNEELEITNHEKYQKLVTATKQLTDRNAIMDRILPNTRVRVVQDDDFIDNTSQVTMTDFIEIITDTFYDGGAKTPSMPSIPLAFAANMNSDSIQLLQVNEIHGADLESVYSDTGPPWTSLDHQKSFSYISLGNIPNDHFTYTDSFSSKIIPAELDFTQAILIVSAPGIIYIILFSEGLVPGIRTPKIPQLTGFYFLFIFFVFTSFSTPFAIGNGMWGTAFGNMDNSTNTNSTQFDSPEYIQISNMTQTAGIETSFQNNTVTETDNVADGPKHYSISISEGLIIGDGSPTNTQTQNEPIFEEILKDVQISESISLSDIIGKEEKSQNSINISESVSLSDRLEAIITLPYGVIRLNETISFTDETDVGFGLELINISESISLSDYIKVESHRSLNTKIDVSESIEFSSQIAIDGITKLQINEFLIISGTVGIHPSTVRIDERLQLSDYEENQFIGISLINIPVTSLIPQNSTLVLNGTSYVETNQDISESTKEITVSAWVKPEFNSGTPEMVALSKDLTFQIRINNLVEPHKVPVFAIYDGMKWHEVKGKTPLEEGKWHHITGVLDKTEIIIFVDGIQQEVISIPELVIVGKFAVTTTEMGISISESNIVIGADHDSDKTTSKFSGEISGVLVHNKALDVEFINEVLQNTAPFATTKIVLTETVQILDTQGLSGKDAVNINESISFQYTVNNGSIILPRIYSERIDLLSVNGTYTNSTIALNGTGFVTVEDTISSDINTMSISSWIKPEFHVGNPQYTIASKDNSFNLFIRNTSVESPSHTIGFSVFDGVKWTEILGHQIIDEKWHHAMAFVNGSKISLYVNGNLEDEKTLQNEFSIGNNGQYSIQDSQISISDSEIIIGAYVSKLREEAKITDKFIGKIASVDVYTEVLNAEQISYKYETELAEIYKIISLYETIQIGDQTNLLYEFIKDEKSYRISLQDAIHLDDSILVSGLDNTVHLNEFLNIGENVLITNTAVQTFNVILDEMLSLEDYVSTGQTSVQLDEILSLEGDIRAMNPFAPLVNPEIQMIKSGFLITENPKFELEYYSDNHAAKIDHQQILNATSIANQLQENLASAPADLLTTGDVNEVETAIQIIDTRMAILELEEQVEQIPEDVNIEDIKPLLEILEEVADSIDETAEKLEETRLEDKAKEIEDSADIIREAADIKQSLNQTGTWETTHEIINTKIIAPDGTVFADEAFFEKIREGKFGIEISADPTNIEKSNLVNNSENVQVPRIPGGYETSDIDSKFITPKPGVYTIENTITVDNNQYTINEEFAWGLVSLNAKKSTYYPGETAEFVIVVLDSVGSPVCDANLVMSINGTTLSSGAGITANEECGIYDAKYETGVEGTYQVDISAIADGIQTGFETTFDVANFVEFDIIRTAQSKIDPINNPNEFEVIVDITSHIDATSIEIVETVPSVFEIITDGKTSTENGTTTITWDKTLDNDSTKISYTYSVPFIFPELYPLGEIQINYDGKTYNEARPWFVANDPVNLSSNVKIIETSANGPSLTNRQGLGSGLTSLGDLDGDGVNDLAVGATQGDKLYQNTYSSSKNGAVFIMYMNANGSIKSTVTIDKDTANGPGSDATNGYGTEVENLGDLDDDGVVDIAVGSRFENSEEGVVHIHYLNANGSIKSTVTIDDDTANGPSLTAGDRYGSDIANMGDMDGDGVNDLAIGAQEDSSSSTNEGAVYIHYMNSNGSIKSTVKINDATTNGATLSSNYVYGTAVENIGDLDGDGVNDLAIGAPSNSSGKGFVYIHYMNANGSIKSTVTVDGQTLPGDKTYNTWCTCYILFGTAVANIGDQDDDGVTDIAVGASMFGYGADRDGNGSIDSRMDKGAVFVLNMYANGTVKNSYIIDDKTTNGPEIWNSANTWTGQFGSSIEAVDINNDLKLDLIVGASSDKETGTPDGAVWIIFYNGAQTTAERNLRESISFSDVVNTQAEVALSESILFTDITNAGLGKAHIFFVESISFTDSSIVSGRDVTQWISETVPLSESIVVNFHIFYPSLTETISFSDVGTGALETGPVISGTLEITKDSDGDRQAFGMGMASLGDLDNNGAMDLAIGAAEGDRWYGSYTGTYWDSSKKGAVYITYMNTDGSIKSTVTIDKDTTNGPGSGVDSSYGKAIENIGDWDGDGVNDIAVGMPGPHNNSAKGEVHIHFMNANGSVKSTVTIDDDTANGPSLTAGDRYGSDIANMGDMDGDGVNDLAVGADEDSSVRANNGAVYIHYMNSNGSIKSTVKINDNTANGPAINSRGNYGNSVENIGDLDGDGVNDLAVGELNHTSHSGTGYVNIHFMNSNGSIKSTARIDPTTMEGDKAHTSYTNFGSAIVNIGDHDKDGVTDIAVGAMQEGYFYDSDGDGGYDYQMSKGGVYLLHMNTNGSVKESFRINEDVENGPAIGHGHEQWYGQFGSSIAAADINDNKRLDLIVGSPSDRSAGYSGTSARGEGAVFVIFDRNGSTYLKSTTQAISESISFTDVAGKRIVTSLSESLSVTDVHSAARQISISESISFTDTAVRHDLKIGNVVTISFTDTITIEKDVTQFIDETVSLTDTADGERVAVELSETLALTDAITITREFGLYSSTEINHNTSNAPDLTNRQGFGASVASLGDMDGDGVVDIAVGTQGINGGRSSPWEPFQANVNGAVYIMYLNSDGSVKSTVTIDKDTTNGPGSGAGHGYGQAIASLGDLDGDGVTDIAVGDLKEDNQKGRILIHYLNSNGSVKSTVEIKHGTANGPSLSNNDEYGVSIANMGDLDGDGVVDIAVGAFLDDDAGTDTGAVYIHYLNSNGSVKSTVKINHDTTNGATSDSTNFGNQHYGRAVANIGDLDGDGVTDMAVSEPRLSSYRYNGPVNVHFMNSNGSIKSTVEIDGYGFSLTSRTAYAYSQFGTSIVGIGDRNNDGVPDMAIGAAQDGWGHRWPDNTHVNEMGKGSVHVLEMNSDGSVKNNFRINEMETNGPSTLWKDADGSFTTNDDGWACCGDQFGSSMAHIGDLDGDNQSDLIVGAWQDNTVGNLGSSWKDKGAIWIIQYSGSKPDDTTSNIKNLSESISLTDTTSLEQSITQAISESVTFSDSVSKKLETRLSESVSLTDATTGKKEIVLVGLTESVSLTDSVSEENSGSVYLTESISLNDNVRKDTVTELSESVMFDDSASTGQQYTKALSESVSLTDATSLEQSITQAISESISFSDSISKTTVTELSESVMFDDSISKTTVTELSESVMFDDRLSKTTVTELSESVMFDDRLSKTTVTELSESVMFDDSISKTVEVPIVESVLLADIAERSKLIIIPLTEEIRFIDTISKIIEIPIVESISLVDIISKNKTISIALSESISVADNISKTVEIPLAELIVITDTAYKAKTIGVSLSEELQLQTSSHSAPTDIIAVDAETDGVNGFDLLNGATGVTTVTIGASTYAIVTGSFDNGVTMIDVSDPTDIVVVDAETDGVNGFSKIWKGQGVDTFTIGASTYAIVTSNDNLYGRDGVQIIDISDPTDIVATDAEWNGFNGFTRLTGAQDVETFVIGSSTYAIVTAYNGNGVQIIDVSDPTDIVAVDEAVNCTFICPPKWFNTLGRPAGVATFTIDSSTYAIVTANWENGVQIIDLSDPTDIVELDSERDSQNGFTELFRPFGVDTFTIGSSTYAIVASQNDSGVQIIDVSDPTDIVAVDAETDGVNGFTELEWSRDVETFTSGTNTYAIVTGQTDSGVQIIDVSDPTDIVAVDAETDGVNGFTELLGAQNVDVFTIGASTYAIVASQQDDGVQIIKLSTATSDDKISMNKSINISLAESIQVTDSLDRIKSQFVSLSEIISFTASLSENKYTVVPLAESVLFIDNTGIGKATTTYIIESISLTDNFSKNASIKLDEFVTVTDETLVAKVIAVPLSEVIALTDNTSKIFEKILSESISLTANTSIDGTTTVKLSETISLTDGSTYTKKIGVSISESVQLIDFRPSSTGEGLVVGKTITQSLTESISFTDSITRTPIKNLSESITLSDLLDTRYSPRIVEAVSFTDTVEIQRSPLAPHLFAVPAEDIVTLAWNPQSDSRVATITDYVIQHSIDEINWNTINDGVNSVRAYSVEPSYPGCPKAPMPCMENGVDSYFRVQAINNLGTGEWSIIQDAMPESDDNEFVREVVVTPQPEKFTVSWDPHPDYSTDIVDYLVYYANAPSGPWTLHDDGYNTFTTVTIDGISSFEPTFVKVQPVMESNNGCAADEEKGPGASQIAWTMPLKQTPRQIPTADIFTFPEDDSVTIEWEKPRSGGAEIWNYEIQKRMTLPGMPEPVWDNPEEVWVTADAFDWYEYEILGLMSDSKYQFQIRGVNEIGSGVWSNIIKVQTKEGEIHNFHDTPDVWWGDDYMDNDYDGWIDEEDEQRYGPPAFKESFDYSAEGTNFGDDQFFGGRQDFGAGQTFGDNTEFYAGQTFDDDVNFSGKNIKFNGANFQNAETFGDGAAFTGTQTFTGQNTFGDSTEFRGTQNFDSAIQTFGDGVKFHGATDFADGQTFGANTEFADGQTFDASEDYDFETTGLDFGAGTAFGRAEVFGRGAEFNDGAVDFYGTNTFGYGTKFAAGQDFDAPQIFGQGVDFEDNMEFADGQVFTLDFDFNEEGLEFGANTVFCDGEEIGAGAEFKGAVQLGGATKFKGEEGKPIKFAAGQDFEDYIHDFIGEVEFMGEMDFREGQDFEGDVEFKGLFDYNDMVGKKLEFKGDDVHFFMPPPVLIGDEIYVPPLAIPPGTVFGDGFDYDDMFSDTDNDGVNDEYYLFEPGVEFAAETRFPPMIEFADGFSKDDMLGKTFTFDEGVFFAGDPIFPPGQKIKPGVMWDEPPTFEAGVSIDPGLALPINTKFSADLELPAFVATPYGMLLAPVTCEDEHCIPDESAYLEPGELLPPGVDPAPVVNFITNTNKTFANPGLGFEMAFDTVAKDGKVNVDLQDPTTVPETTPGDTPGQRSMTSGTGIFQNVGSIIDVSVDTASATGAMTVTLPYDESTLGDITEDEIVLLHYTGGEWVTVDNITVDKENNKVSGTVNSLSPFTVGKQTGTVSTGSSSTTGTSGAGAGAGGGGGGGGAVIGSEESQKAGYPTLKIVELTYDTNSDIVRVTVAPEYEKTDIIIKTVTGFELATKIGTHPILNQAIYEAPLLANSGPIQVSATAFVKSIIIESTPLVATISAGTTTIKPEEDIIRPPVITSPSKDFQKPDDFITDAQCPFGTNLIGGKCVQQTFQEQPLPIQFGVILLLVMLAIGLTLTIEIRRRKARKIVSSQLVFETKEDIIRPPVIPKSEPPVIIPQELEPEKAVLIQLLKTLQTQEEIQKKINLLESQLLEHVNEEVEVREKLTTLIKLVEIRLNLVEPLLAQQLKALPRPKRTYKKKRKVLTVEHKAKIAAARRGKKQTEITKQKISDSRIGKRMSESTKRKISKSRKTLKNKEVQLDEK